MIQILAFYFKLDYLFYLIDTYFCKAQLFSAHFILEAVQSFGPTWGWPNSKFDLRYPKTLTSNHSL